MAKNQLGSYVVLDIFSKDHVLYNDKNKGEIGSWGLPKANIATYDRKGLGIEGVSKTAQTFTDQPWSYSGETDRVVNKWMGVFANQNPEDVEGETSGSDVLVVTGGAIELDAELDLISNVLDETRTNVISSVCIFKSTKNASPTSVPTEGSNSVALEGTGKRGYNANKPTYYEGWLSNISVAEQSVPDNTALVGSGPAWLRRAAGTFVPRKVNYKGATSPVIAANAANSRYVALVLYETGMEYNNLALTTVDGAENAVPVKVLDAAIEAAVDAIDTGARWVRLADILITEVAPAAVVINTADIEAVTKTTFTYNKTALIISAQFATDSFLMHDYLIQIREDGVYKEDRVNITSDTATVLTYSAATSDMIEIAYWTEPFAYTSPLSGT